MGQSNMQGLADRPADDTSPVDGALEYKFLTDEFAPLAHPAGENITYDYKKGPWYGDTDPDEWVSHVEWNAVCVVGAAAHRYTNIVPHFAEAYQEKSGRSIIAVCASKGATSIDKWIPGTAGYNAIRDKTHAALRLAEKCGHEIGGVYGLWLQGENDAIEKTAPHVYTERLIILKNALKADVGLSKFGIIRAFPYTNSEWDDIIFDAQCAAADMDDDFAVISRMTEDMPNHPELLNQYIYGHVGTEGFKLLGEQAGENYATLLAGETYEI